MHVDMTEMPNHAALAKHVPSAGMVSTVPAVDIAESAGRVEDQRGRVDASPASVAMQLPFRVNLPGGNNRGLTVVLRAGVDWLRLRGPETPTPSLATLGIKLGPFDLDDVLPAQVASLLIRRLGGFHLRLDRDAIRLNGWLVS